jgi:hypothetical protein
MAADELEREYTEQAPDISSGPLDVVASLLRSAGVQSLSGLKGLSELPNGTDAAASAVRDYQAKYAPQDLSPEGQSTVRNYIAPAMHAIHNAAALMQRYFPTPALQLANQYHPAVEGAASIAGKVAPELGGIVGATGEALPYAVNPGGGAEAGALEGAAKGVAISVKDATEVGHPTAGLIGYHPDAKVIDAHSPEGEHLGRLIAEPSADGSMLQGRTADVFNENDRGQGIGSAMLKRGIDHAHENGMDWGSDVKLSPGQVATYMKLQEKGYPMHFNPTSQVEDDKFLTSGDGNPVLTIPKPTDAATAQVGETPQFGQHHLAGYQAPQELEDFVRSNAPPHRVDPNGPASWEELQASRNEPVMPINPQSAENSIYSDTPTNIAFRAWHDKLHLDLNAGFDHEGELKVAQEHLRQAQAAGLSEEAQRALWADTWETFKHHEDTGAFPSDPRAFVADKMKSQFPGDGSMLNIGLNQGQEGMPGFRQMDPQEAQSAVESTGAGVTKSSLLTPQQHGVAEPTAVISTDRALSEPEMQNVLAQTKQSAIPQRTNSGVASMHIAPGHEQTAQEQGWDTFNPQYFQDHPPDAIGGGPTDANQEPPGMAEGGEASALLDPLEALVSKYASAPPTEHAGILAGEVADKGAVTYNPTSGDVHSGGYAVPTDPSRSLSMDSAPTGNDIHDFILNNNDAFKADPKAAVHIESDQDGNHFLHVAHVEPDFEGAMAAARQSGAPGVREIHTGTNFPVSHGSSESIGAPESDQAVEDYLAGSKVPGANLPAELDTERNERPSVPWTPGQQTVANPQRNAFPGIYGDPRKVISDANQMVGPEDPLLQRLFGVSRQDLSDIAQGRQGNELGVLPGAKKGATGAASAQGVMTPQNEQRLIDVLSEARGTPLHTGMTGWYSMDPLYERFKQIFGEQDAPAKFARFNTLMGMASPGSDVGTEIARGSSANWLDTQGRFPDFQTYGGVSGKKRQGMPDFPEDMMNVPGHAYHPTAQAGPMADYLRTGALQMKSPKVPMYIGASGVPDYAGPEGSGFSTLGNQSDMPVGDAHWARGVGLADTRNWRYKKGEQTVPGSSVSTPEMQTLGPWWRDRVAAQAGYQAVPAQATAWGAFAPYTGVTSAIGAPKLEILATQIGKTAQRLGVSPETARDMVLRGETGAFGHMDPTLRDQAFEDE